MEDLFRSKDLPHKLTAYHLSLTNGPFQVGVALSCIGVALLEVGVACATPKVYKSPPLKRPRLDAFPLPHGTRSDDGIGVAVCKTFCSRCEPKLMEIRGKISELQRNGPTF